MYEFDKWITYGRWYIGRKELPIYPTVYVIYLNEELVYIGQTNNLNVRINTHRISIDKGIIKTRWGVVGDIYIKVKCPSRFGEEAMIEKRLIERLRPKYNKRFYDRTKHKKHFLWKPKRNIDLNHFYARAG